MNKTRGLRYLSFFWLVMVTVFLTTAVRSAPIPASIVMNLNTGEVLHTSNADRSVYPASLTKMMTLYLMFDAFQSGQLRMDTPIYFSRHAVRQRPTKLGVKTGQSITAKQAMLALMIKSANDVAAAVAEHMAGSESQFARIMTRKARELGMVNTTFKNASGLPHLYQKTTARDMVVLARALLNNHPHYYTYFQTKSMYFRGRTLRNHNKLLGKVQGVDGIKTGYTASSGFNLTTSAVHKNQRIIAVVIGGTSLRARDAKMRNLLKLAYNRIEGKLGETYLKRNPQKFVLAHSTLGKRQKIKTALKTPHKSSWGVQVGAFRSVQKAKLAARKAINHLKIALGMNPQVSLQRTNRGKVTQSRLIAMTEREAKLACRSLQKNHMSCFTMRMNRTRIS